MYILDFKKEAIRKVSNQEMCDFCNNLIADQSKEFLGKRYMFLATKAQALYLVTKMLKDKK
jgi:hypothetical protein